ARRGRVHHRPPRAPGHALRPALPERAREAHHGDGRGVRERLRRGLPRMSSAFYAPPDDYYVVESNDQVRDIKPALRTRFRRRAAHRARRLNSHRRMESYHWKVVAIIGTGRYEVRAFQNFLVPR